MLSGRLNAMTDHSRPIVVGANGSAAALRAARWAGAVAERLTAPLVILAAEPYLRHNLSDAGAAVWAAELAEFRDSVDGILRSARESVLGDHPEVVVTTSTVTEPADRALIAASRDARLVVLACDDVTATGAVLAGSVTLATVAHAMCPIVAWRDDSASPNPLPTSQPIVVGVDGSDSDGGALQTAFELAENLGAPLRAIHSWMRGAPAAERNLPSPLHRDSREENQWGRLDELVERWRGRYPGVEITQICVPGKPSAALVEHAADAQLVVVGSRRRNPLTRGLFGSTSLNLLHHSKVPVVLCPFAEHD